MSVNTIFFIGALLFAGASAYFWLVNDNKEFNSPLLVTGITTLSYLVMLEGSLATQLADGAVIHWTRWVGYALSCPLLFYAVASGVASIKRRVTLSALMSLVMLSGAFTAVWTGWLFWAGFIFSSFLLTVSLITLYERSDGSHLKPMHKYIWFGWIVFPVVFLLGPSGLYIGSVGVAAFLYLLLDVFTKIVFYAEFAKLQKKRDSGYLAELHRYLR